MEPFFELDLDLLSPQHLTLVNRVARQLKTAIIDERLKYGVRLPSSRSFAKYLGISRNSVMSVYELLLQDNLIETKVGAGTYVCWESSILPKEQNGNNKTTSNGSTYNENFSDNITEHWRKHTEREIIPRPPPLTYNFYPGSPDLTYFPYQTWRKCIVSSARKQERSPHNLPPTQGHLNLRRQLATHQSWSRAISSHADDFLITSGAQQAFDLIAKIMISPNQTTVAIEDPGYPLALQLFQSYGAKIVLIPLDKEGMIIDKIPNNVDLIYCTPSHQFPLGMPMSINRRSALLKYARDNHCLIIEDDYDSEFRLTQRPLDALKSMDTHDLVFYVGTFSKSLLPDLRVGFIIMPKWAKTSLCGTKLLTDWHNNWLIQDALADFIQQGHLIKHLKKMRKLYSDRYSTLTQWIKQHENSKMHIINAYAGVHVSAILRDDNNAKSIASSLKEHKISILSIEDLCPSNAPMNGLIFGYGNIESSHIIQALPIISEQLNRRPIS